MSRYFSTCSRLQTGELPDDCSVLVPEVAKAVLVCKYFPGQAVVLTAPGVLLFLRPVIRALDIVKSILEVMNKEVPPFPAHGNCSSQTGVWDYLTRCGD